MADRCSAHSPKEEMLIRILIQNPGSVFEVGQLLKVGDVHGNAMIRDGIGEQVDEIEVAKPPVKRTPRGRGNPFLLPPRFLHRCGYVGTDEADLEKHAADCQ